MPPFRAVWLACSLGIAVCGVTHVQAQDATKLGGTLFIAGKTPIDPPAGESRNTHAYVTVSGTAALQMYRNMRAKPEKDLCQEGNMIKRAGPLSCSLAKGGRTATCDFSVDLVQGVLADGRPC